MERVIVKDMKHEVQAQDEVAVLCEVLTDLVAQAVRGEEVEDGFRPDAGRQGHVGLLCAGGWVRDLLLGLESKDVDIIAHRHYAKYLKPFIGFFESASQTPFEKLLETKEKIKYKIYNQKSQPLSQGKLKGKATLYKFNIDITFEDKELKYEFDMRELDANNPDIPSDLKTRDFTINGLYFDFKGREIWDFCGGIQDCLEMKQLKCINSKEETFDEDISRYFRAVRFMAKCGFEADRVLGAALKDCSQQIAKAPGDVKHAIFGEMFKFKYNKHLPAHIKLLFEFGMIEGMNQTRRYPQIIKEIGDRVESLFRKKPHIEFSKTTKDEAHFCQIILALCMIFPETDEKKIFERLPVILKRVSGKKKMDKVFGNLYEDRKSRQGEGYGFVFEAVLGVTLQPYQMVQKWLDLVKEEIDECGRAGRSKSKKPKNEKIPQTPVKNGDDFLDNLVRRAVESKKAPTDPPETVTVPRRPAESVRTPVRQPSLSEESDGEEEDTTVVAGLLEAVKKSSKAAIDIQGLLKNRLESIPRLFYTRYPGYTDYLIWHLLNLPPALQAPTSSLFGLSAETLDDLHLQLSVLKALATEEPDRSLFYLSAMTLLNHSSPDHFSQILRTLPDSHSIHQQCDALRGPSLGGQFEAARRVRYVQRPGLGDIVRDHRDDYRRWAGIR